MARTNATSQAAEKLRQFFEGSWDFAGADPNPPREFTMKNADILKILNKYQRMEEALSLIAIGHHFPEAEEALAFDPLSE